MVNHSGINVGYKITVQWYTFELPPPPEFEPPELDTTDQQPAVSGPFDFAVTESQASADEPSATPRKILVPGPDGELREIDLPFFAAGQRIAAGDDGGISPWLPAANTSMRLGLGLFLVPPAFIANPALLRPDESLLLALAATLKIGLGVALLSYAAIGMGGRTTLRVAGLVAGLGITFFWGI